MAAVRSDFATSGIHVAKVLAELLMQPQTLTIRWLRPRWRSAAIGIFSCVNVDSESAGHLSAHSVHSVRGKPLQHSMALLYMGFSGA